MESLDDEIERIRRNVTAMENKAIRRDRVVAAAIVLGLLLYLLAVAREGGWPRIGHWTVGEFYVRSSQDKTRVWSGATEDQSSLVLYDSQKRPHIRLSARDAGSSLTFLGPDQIPQAEFASSERGAMLRFFDTNQKPRVQVSLLANKPEVLLLDDNGNVVFRAP